MFKLCMDLKKCVICGKKVKESSMKTHMKMMHQNSKHFPCDLCDQVLTNKYNLAQHVIDIHKINKMIKCEKYNLDIKENIFKRHMTQKHGKEHICTVCKKKYSSNRVLKDHILNIHEQTKQKCDKCEKLPI